MVEKVARGPKPPNARQLMNEWNIKVYAGVITGLLAVFIISHWVNRLQNRYHKSAGWRNMPGVSIWRKWTRLLSHQVSVFPSLGHALLVFIYFGVNIVFLFINVDASKIQNYAARWGWLYTGNMVLSVFLGLKNTPLSFLVHYSHDKLNFFHQAVGYTAVLQMLGHGLLYIARYQIQHRMEKLLEKDNMIGVVAGIFMLVLGCGALRRIKYEVFYISHIIGCIAALILTGLHRPNWVEKICIAMLLAAGMWSFDRIIRASRLLYNLASNNASVYPLADNAVKIVFKKQLFGAKAGSHCFIWIPGLRLFQTHPFTIVSNRPSGLELVIKAYDGFTKSLYDKAVMSPGLSLRASFDGPYGSFPDLAHYDKLVFLAGGSGATFTFGLVNSLLEQSGPETVQQVDFIWATKTKESVYWFAEHLEKLNSHRSRVSSTVYITGEAQGSAYTSELEEKTCEIGTKNTTNLPEPDGEKSKEFSQSDSSLERQQGAQLRSLSEDISIAYGKLDVSSVIQAKIQDCQAGERVLVAACGPSSLLKATTDATARCITSKGPSIELHYEAFAW